MAYVAAVAAAPTGRADGRVAGRFGALLEQDSHRDAITNMARLTTMIANVPT
jgi:hypothetical protein